MNNFTLLPMADAPPAPSGRKTQPASSDDPPFASVLKETGKDRPDDYEYELVAQAMPPPNQEVAVVRAPDSGSDDGQEMTPPEGATGSLGQVGDTAGVQTQLVGSPEILPDLVTAPAGLIFLSEEDGSLIETPKLDLIDGQEDGSPIETPKLDPVNLGPQPTEGPAVGKRQPVVSSLFEASTDPLPGDHNSLQPVPQSDPRRSEEVLSADKPATASKATAAAVPEHLNADGKNESAFSQDILSEPKIRPGANQSSPGDDPLPAMLGTETAKIQTAERNSFEPARLAEARDPTVSQLAGNPKILPELVTAPAGLIFLGEEDGSPIETPKLDLVNGEEDGSPIETPKFNLVNLGPKPIEGPAGGKQQPVDNSLFEASTGSVSGGQNSLRPDPQSHHRMSEDVLSDEKPAVASKATAAAVPEHLSAAGKNESAFSRDILSEPAIRPGANKSPPGDDPLPAMLGTETAKIQTAEPNSFEPARLAEARDPKLASQLAQGFETLSKSGRPSLRLQLYPQNLGKVDLRIYSGADGLHLTLSATQPETGALLERYLPELRQALEDAGVNLGRLAVGKESAQGNPSNSEQWNSGNRPATSSLSPVPDQPDHTEEVASNPRTWSSSKVDYLI